MSAREVKIPEGLDSARLPRHVAIIMDGNGRWARQRGFLDRTRGHRAGVDAVRAATRTAAELGIHALTLYAFSEENWSRPKSEISVLMSLLKRFLKDEIPELSDNNIRLVTSGRLHRLPDEVLKQMDDTMRATASNTGLILNLALSYGGRAEIVDAAKAIIRKAIRGEIAPEVLTEEMFARHLYQPDLPDPDLIIRTSGERRVSNFLIWEGAYSEYYFSEVLWPDFNREVFLEALFDYQNRDRRFGGIS
ncbi:MAG TPA: isoprenyl transferase [Candidatus Sumerlaeota bacterium]|nr:isoprenyl transferase [Candidatus Sumerlaeota bacterium]